ncbi:MAG: Flp pilus assembly protein CpaB, partial [Planctomycetes bacterium]|nr:Flp pilus assembly protein CpaB [Planctomycetota bacterium]
MNAKSMIPLVVGLAIGGYALKLVVDTVKNAKGAEPDTVQVWAAREDIPRGSSIDESMILAVEFPTAAVPEGAFTAKEELIGRVPRITSPAQLPILESMLLAPGAKAGLWVRPGFRAVSIKIDESSGVSNLLQPGSWVDVVGY